MTFKELRESKKLTQAKLAQRVPCDQTTISLLERGRIHSPRYELMDGLAKALRTSVAKVHEAIQNTPKHHARKAA